MKGLVLGIVVAYVFLLLSSKVQATISYYFERIPGSLLLLPFVLAGLFLAGAPNLSYSYLALTALLFLQLGLATFLAFSFGQGKTGRLVVPLDFGILLVLWFPIEFPFFATQFSGVDYNYLRHFSYASAVVTALSIFLCFRRLTGVKYNWPYQLRDVTLLPITGFLLLAPVLVMIGRWLEFIPPFHTPQQWSILLFAGVFTRILFAVALPEEILFRGFIQNFLCQRLGQTEPVIVLSALIFGAAHLNNAPAPNWKYAVVASIAGYGFGKVFQRSQTIFASAIVHALVNTTKFFFF